MSIITTIKLTKAATILTILAGCSQGASENNDVGNIVINGNNNSGNVVISGSDNNVIIKDGRTIVNGDAKIYSDDKGNEVITNSSGKVIINNIQLTP